MHTTTPDAPVQQDSMNSTDTIRTISADEHCSDVLTEPDPPQRATRRLCTRHSSSSLLLGDSHRPKQDNNSVTIFTTGLFLFPLSKSSGLSSLSCPILKKDNAIETNVERQRTVQGSQLSSISSSITPARGLNPRCLY